MNNTALQHRALLLLGFPLFKLFLKSFWLYSWLLLQNWVLQQIPWLTKGKKILLQNKQLWWLWSIT